MIETANLEAGLNGLWESGRRMTMQALAYKLLEDLEKAGVGTGQVEAEAWARTVQRENKKGRRLDRRYKNRVAELRDQRYIVGLLKLRSAQAKEDWKKERENFRRQREWLEKNATGIREKNLVKREMISLSKENCQTFKRGKEEHGRKLEFLRKKHKDRERIRKKEIGETYEEWLERISRGTGRGISKEPEIPNYGNNPLDPNEKAALRLPAKFATLGKLSPGDARFETVLCYTKLRW